jgi:predicted homoserine dehydrogenase-like protein
LCKCEHAGWRNAGRESLESLSIRVDGGFATRGRLLTSEESIRRNLLPLGLSGGAKAKRNIKKNDFLSINDVEIIWNKYVKAARKYQTELLL